MKKGINIWSFENGLNMADCIRKARQAGFEGIELAMAEKGEVSLQSSEQELKELRKVAEGEGVELPSLATGLYWSYSLTSNDSAVRQKARDIALRQLETAAVLGADTILVVPGAVGVDFIPNHPVVDYAAAYDRSLEALTALKGRAEALRIHIGLENVWNKFLLSPLEMRDFIDRIDSPYMGAYLDVGNVIPTGYPEHWTAILNHRIRKVHFKDFRRAVGTLPGFVDLLAGDVNYPAVMAALGKAGYDGYVIAEMIPAYGHYPDQILYNTSASMDRILGRGGVSL